MLTKTMMMMMIMMTEDDCTRKLETYPLFYGIGYSSKQTPKEQLGSDPRKRRSRNKLQT